MLSRPSDNGHTPFGDIFYSDSQDLEYRGHHHLVNEQVGDVPIVVFPCAALCDAATGRLTVYYGGCRYCGMYGTHHSGYSYRFY